MKFSMKRLAALVLALVMVFGLLPVVNNTVNAVNALGQSGSLTDTTIGWTSTTATGNPNYNNSKWTASGNAITGAVQGTHPTSKMYMAATATLRITNNKSSAANLTFDYTITAGNNGTVAIDGQIVTGGSFETKLDANAYIEIKLTANRSTTGVDNMVTINITNLILASASNDPVTTTFEAPAFGSYTVAYGNETMTVAAGTPSQTATNLPSVAYTLTANPGEGYKLVGWYNVTTDTYLGTELVYTGSFEDACTVKAVVVPEGAPVFKAGTNYYADLNDAVAYAQSKGVDQITMVQSGTLPAGDYTIPAGITLLIPMDTEYTPTRTDDEDFGVAPEFTTEAATPYAFLTMTMADGAKLTVNGTLDVESKHTSLQGGKTTGGRPCGPYGAIYMNPNASITVNNGANLYVWGYIYGEGSVTANSGAKVYEIMQVTDFPGGSNMSQFVDTDPTFDVDGDGNPSNDYFKTFPFSQYYVQNIEVALTLKSGAAEYVYITMTAGGQSMGLPVRFIGEGGMFVPGEGGTIVKDYDPSTDRLNVTVNGDASMAGIALDLSGTKYEGAVEDVLGTSKVDSSSFILTLNGNITINIASGTTTVKQDLSLLPGVEINIAKGATLVVAERTYADDEYDNLTVFGSYTGYNIYVWDLDNWGNYVFKNKPLVSLTYSPTTGRYVRTADDLKDVKIDINGTVICEGYIYSTVNFDDEAWMPLPGAGAQVISTGKTGKLVLQNGPGPEDMAYCLDGYSDKDSAMFVDSVWLMNGDGTYVLTEGCEPGATYLYCEGHDCWYTEGHKDRTVEITWLIDGEGGAEEYVICSMPSYKGSIPTKPQNGCTIYAFAGWSNSPNGEVLAELPIVEVDEVYYAIFTESLSHSWSNADCDTPKTCVDCGETEGSALGHKWNDADCDTPKTCGVCGETEGSALGHKWNDADCTTAKTCGVCGETEGEALGHSWVDPDCDNDGYCRACGAEGEAALGHQWEELSSDDNGDGTHTDTYQCAHNLSHYKYETNDCTNGGDDEDHLCDVCFGELTTCFDSADENHDCDICGAEDVDGGHYGGVAYCNALKLCDECGERYGSLDPNNHATDGYYEVESDNKHHIYYSCCGVYGESEDCSDMTGDGDHGCDKCVNGGITDCVSDAAFSCQSGYCVECGTDMPAAGAHGFDYDCDKFCNICGEEVWPDADHSQVNGCDTQCQYCGLEIWPDAVCESDADYFCQDGNCIWCGEPVSATEDHEWADPDCVNDGYCINCGETGEPALGHGAIEGWECMPEDNAQHQKWCADCWDYCEMEGHDFVGHVCDDCEWTEEMSVKFYNGTELWTEITVPYGNTLGIAGMPVPAAPTGYKFAGWYTEGGVHVVHGMTVTSNIEAYATFEKNTFTVTWLFNGGVMDAQTKQELISEGFTVTDTSVSGSFEYGDFAPGASGVTKDGYILIGFTDQYGKFNEGQEVFTLTEDMTFTMVWECKHAEKTYTDLNNGYHKITCDTCGETLNEAAEHVYDQEWSKTSCICGAVKEFKLTVVYGPNGEYTYEAMVPYRTPMADLDGINNIPWTIYVNDATHLGHYDLDDFCWDMDGDGELDRDHYFTEGSMPAHDHYVEVRYIFTGFVHDGNGWQIMNYGYMPKNEVMMFAMSDLYENGSGELEGIYMADANGYRIENGLGRFYYIYNPFSGINYEPNAEDIAYYESKGQTFIDKEMTWYYFGADGKLQFDYTGLVGDSYVINGQAAWHVGLVQIDGEYYYFKGDEVNGGNKMVSGGDFYLNRNNTDFNMVVGGIYTFDENGVMQLFHGIVESELFEGKRHYIGGRLTPGLGLVDLITVSTGEVRYFYVDSYGQLILDAEYYIGANSFGLAKGIYYFDAEGFLVIPEPEPGKSGLFFEEGKWYYYVDGAKAYCAGLIEIDGNWVYVKSDGSLATGTYYITNNNGHATIASGTKCTFDENGVLIDPVINMQILAEGSASSGEGFNWEEDHAALIFTPSTSGKLIIEVSNIVLDVDYENVGFMVDVYAENYGWLGENFVLDGSMEYNVSADIGRCIVYIFPAYEAGDYCDPASGTYDYKITFGNDGSPKNGIIDGYYYVDGHIAYAAGLIEIDGIYYYVRSNGQIVTDCQYWITNVNDTGYEPGLYEFDEDGWMYEIYVETFTGIKDGYYYIEDKIAYNAGLMIYNGGYIYVRSNGQVATGKYWITNHNDLLPEGFYDFGEDGFYYPPVPENAYLLKDVVKNTETDGGNFGRAEAICPSADGYLYIQVTDVTYSEDIWNEAGFYVDFDSPDYWLASMDRICVVGTGTVMVPLSAGDQLVVYVNPADVGVDGYASVEGTIAYKIWSTMECELVEISVGE